MDMVPDLSTVCEMCGGSGAARRTLGPMAAPVCRECAKELPAPTAPMGVHAGGEMLLMDLARPAFPWALVMLAMAVGLAAGVALMLVVG